MYDIELERKQPMIKATRDEYEKILEEIQEIIDQRKAAEEDQGNNQDQKTE